LERALPQLDRARPCVVLDSVDRGKWIELQLDDPARLAELPRVEALMRVSCT